MNTYTELTNERIGELGEAFIQKRIELGLQFEDVWDEWASISRKLKFILVDCPEVLEYCWTDAIERKRLRDVAKTTFGKATVSDDVELLCRAANRLDVTIPVRPYTLELELLREFFEIIQNRIEEMDGITDELVEIRNVIENENGLEAYQQNIQNFASEHSLWAVPPDKVIRMYVRHVCKEE